MTAAPSGLRHTPRTRREIRLAAHPTPRTPLTDDLFGIAEVPIPSPN
ncbi:hypothetical protein [Streptantibioticus cattleyicolor]|uniref:Putative dehydrogenase n=1 Tax=Streptantibioticus cattleyicolor (strain ATCC 35852 / DSM 46488 / JCM 4925 / NBRC 14057 / NRRL 8057) TaxID=1003195 RepID=G8XDM8_STREN|nr:hypothetical protein [Streptantibioticus cattleyicolor]AEW98222.1 putative dehydrogenase [Streptantibioticus cattleyicolor NRRL 8057 = DSM 46488]